MRTRDCLAAIALLLLTSALTVGQEALTVRAADDATATTSTPAPAPIPANVPANMAAALQVLQQIKTANDDLLRKQQGLLARLDELEKAAAHLKIYSKRG